MLSSPAYSYCFCTKYKLHEEFLFQTVAEFQNIEDPLEFNSRNKTDVIELKYPEAQTEKLKEVNVFIIVCVINSSNFVSYILTIYICNDSNNSNPNDKT